MSTDINFWPSPEDYSRRLQNPHSALRDAALKTCTIECFPNSKQPRPRAGALAAFYRGTYSGTNDNVGIRVFTKRNEEGRERYDEISRYLQGRRRLDCLVDFEYQPKGIVVPNAKGQATWYPVVKMEFVDGLELFDWLQVQCDQQQAQAISGACDRWVELIEELSQAQIAHGDLQQANVMVMPSGQLKLIDYDGMCVPLLVGKLNLEMGLPPYQHPGRDGDTKLYLGMDHFSALFIYVAMRALAHQPKLWETYVRSKDYDKLLFQKDDFEQPSQSGLIRELRQSPDQKVRKLVEELLAVRSGPMANVPPLSHFVNDFESVRQLLSQQSWDDALALLDRNSGQIPPADIAPSIKEARSRVKLRLELEDAVRRGDEEAMARLYLSPLFDNYPKAGAAVAVAKLAPNVLEVLRQLEAAHSAKDWRQFVAIWDRNRANLDGRKSAEKFAKEVVAWRQRNQLCDAVISALAAQPVDAARMEQAWNALKAQGGHPEVDHRGGEIDQTVARQLAFAAFRQVSAIPSEASDRALLEAWNETLFAGWPDAEQERHRVKEGKQRLKKLIALQDAVKQSLTGQSLADEKLIADRAAHLDSRYEVNQRTQQRATLAAQRVRVIDRLEQSLTSATITEKELAQFWSELRQVQAENLLSPQSRSRLDLALGRSSRLKKLEQISPNASVDQRDREILEIWDDLLLGNCSDATPWQSQYRDAVRRKTLRAELQRALDAGDITVALRCVDDPLLNGFPFDQETQTKINAARVRQKGIAELLQVLRGNQRARFHEVFNAQVIRDDRIRFIDYQAKLKDWITTDILPRSRVGLLPPLVGNMLSNGSGKYKAQWRWPHVRFCDSCLWAVCKAPPRGMAQPNDIAIYQQPFTRKLIESGGGAYSFNPKPEWVGRYVVVWAIIDLGFEKIFSEPLLLGRIEA